MSIRTHIGPRKGMLARSRMYVYYVGMVVVGLLGRGLATLACVLLLIALERLRPLLGFTGDASPGVTDALGYTSTTWIFSAGLVLLSIAAIIARRLRAADAEAAFVIGVGAATFVHGAALLSTGSAGWQSGVRLLIAILMMWDWADYRRRETDLNDLVNRAKEHL